MFTTPAGVYRVLSQTGLEDWEALAATPLWRVERLRPDEPWVGYRQFCMLFLYPLMLQAYKDLPFHAALRGSLDGITPHDARVVLARERFRKGVLANVIVHARTLYEARPRA